MKKLFGGEIEFPANPFVALADFLIILLLVMILAVVHQSLGANKVIERTAVSTLQDQLLNKCWSSDDQSCLSPALRKAHARGEFTETYRDGDLQRFRFKHTLFFKKGSSRIATRRGRKLLSQFAAILASSQGDLSQSRTRPFKRVIVEGHADTSEGSSERIWSLSLNRAKEAVVILNQSELSPSLIEASGRGCWEPAKGADKVDSHTASEMNRRLEIVVVYAGPQSIDHINLKSKQERRH